MNNPIKPIEGTTIDSRFEKQTPPIIEVTFGKSPKVTIHSDGEIDTVVNGQKIRKHYLVCWYDFDVKTNKIKYVDSKALTAQPEGGFVWFRTANQDYRNWYIVVKQFHPSDGFADIFVKSYNMRDKWEL